MEIEFALTDKLSRQLILNLLRERPGSLLRYATSYFNRKRTVAQLTRNSLSRVESLYHGILANQRLQRHLEEEQKSSFFYGQGLFKATDLYVLCRLLKPEVVVETGVASGYSTTFLLQALQDEGYGHLYSIDIGAREFDDVTLPRDKEIGWLVPPWLRGRWTLKVGSSLEVLAPLLEELEKINLFFHDSDHSYSTMMFEFQTAWRFLSSPGLLLSDDIDFNSSFHDFCKERHLRSYRILFQLGGVGKEPTRDPTP